MIYFFLLSFVVRNCYGLRNFAIVGYDSGHVDRYSFCNQGFTVQLTFVQKLKNQVSYLVIT